MSNQTHDVFQLYLSSQGAKTLTKTCTIINWALLVSIIWSISSIIVFLFQISNQYRLGNITTTTLVIQAYIIPMISIFQVLLGLVQFYFTFQYVQRTKRSILLNDVDLFNQSFLSMQKGWIVSLVILFISLATGFYYLYYFLSN